MDIAVRRLVLPLVASVAVAGTCLAAPGLALADGEAAFANQQTQEELAAEAASVEGTAYSFGGIQFTVPDDFETIALGSTALASNADGSIMLSVSIADMGEPVPDDSAEWGAYFQPFAEETAENSSAELGDLGLYQLVDGTVGYVYAIMGDQGGIPVILTQVYVPFEDGTFALVQVACEMSDDDLLNLADDISATIMLATDEAQPLDQEEVAEPTDVQQVEAAGIAFDLPAGYTADPDSTEEEPLWASPDQTVMVSVIPELATGYSTMGDSMLALAEYAIVEGLDGTVESQTVLSNDGTDVDVYVFSYEQEGMDLMGILGMVVLPDDSVTGMIAMTPLAFAADNDAEVTAIFESIRIAE